jgi:hypothetical protein
MLLSAQIAKTLDIFEDEIHFFEIVGHPVRPGGRLIARVGLYGGI